MKAWQTRPWLMVTAALALGSGAGPVHAQGGSDSWQWTLAPYLWLPTIDGHVKYDVPPEGGGGPDVSIGPTDWLDLLNFAALFSASASKGQFGLFTDVVYLNMGADNDGRVVSVETEISGPGGLINIPVGADLNLATEVEFDGLQLMLGAGFALVDSEAGRHYVLAGFRFLGIDVKTVWHLTGEVTGPGGETLLDEQGSVDNSVDPWDGIVGLNGHFNPGEDG